MNLLQDPDVKIDITIAIDPDLHDEVRWLVEDEFPDAYLTVTEIEEGEEPEITVFVDDLDYGEEVEMITECIECCIEKAS